MANQDVILNIVAKSDTSSVQAEFGQMATQLARMFDQALEGIGNKLAEVIIKGARAGAQGIYIDPQGKQFQAVPPPGSLPTTATIAAAAGAPPLPPAPPELTQRYIDPFSQPQMSLMRQRSDLDQMLPTGQPMQGAYGQSARLDALLGEARVIQSIKRGGGDVDVSPQQRAEFTEGQQESLQALRNLQNEIGGLRSELTKATQNLGQLDDSLREAPDHMKEGIASAITGERQNIAQRTEEIARLSAQSSSVAQQAQTFGQLGQQGAGLSVANVSRAAGVAGFVGQLMQTGAELPMALQRGRASEAELENLPGRMLMRGDYQQMLALEQLGGRGEAEGSARLRAQTSIGGQALEGGVMGLGGLAVAGGALETMATGGMAAIPLAALAAGGGLAAAGALKTGGAAIRETQLGTETEGQLSQMLQSQTKLNQEQMASLQRGHDLSVQAFRQAQQMGAPELSEFMLGGTGQVGSQRRNLREFGVLEGNITNDQVQRTLQVLGGQMGGNFLGRTPLIQDPSRSQGIADLMRVQGAGLSQAPEIAAGMFAGMGAPGVDIGNQQQRALEMTKEMFEDAVSGGLDKASAGRAMVEMSQRSQQLGLGGAEAARMEMQNVLGLTQNLFGPNQTESQRKFAGDIFQQTQQMTRGQGGIGAISGLRAMERLQEEFGFKVNPAEMETMRITTQTPEGLRQRFEKEGRQDLAGRAEEIAQRSQELRVEEFFKNIKEFRKNQSGLFLTRELLGEGATDVQSQTLQDLADRAAKGEKLTRSDVGDELFDKILGKEPQETRIGDPELARKRGLKKTLSPEQQQTMETLRGLGIKTAPEDFKPQADIYAAQQEAAGAKVAQVGEVLQTQMANAGLKEMDRHLIRVNQALDEFSKKLGLISAPKKSEEPLGGFLNPEQNSSYDFPRTNSVR